MVNNKISDMEQTAVEWLVEQLHSGKELSTIIRQAKEIEQKQNQEIRQKSYMEGYDEGLNDALNK